MSRHGCGHVAAIALGDRRGELAHRLEARVAARRPSTNSPAAAPMRCDCRSRHRSPYAIEDGVALAASTRRASAEILMWASGLAVAIIASEHRR